MNLPEGRVAVGRDVLVQVLRDEVVILNMKSEEYFGLDDIGTRMWQVLTTSETIEQAYRALIEEYQVEPDQLRQDLSELVGNLVDKGLLEIHAAKVEEA